MKITIRLLNNEKEVIANCPELDINCYGANRDEAIRRIKNVIQFYIESARELGLDVENLYQISIEGEQKNPALSDELTPPTNSIN